MNVIPYTSWSARCPGLLVGAQTYHILKVGAKKSSEEYFIAKEAEGYA